MRAKRLTKSQLEIVYSLAEELKRRAEDFASLKEDDISDIIAETFYIRDLVIETRFAMNGLWLHECAINATKKKRKSKNEKTKAQ